MKQQFLSKQIIFSTVPIKSWKTEKIFEIKLEELGELVSLIQNICWKPEKNVQEIHVLEQNKNNNKLSFLIYFHSINL